MNACEIWSIMAMWIALMNSGDGTHQCSIHQLTAIRKTSAFIPRCQANLIDYAPRQCIGETCACVTHDGVNITNWSLFHSDCDCPVAVHEIMSSALHLAIELPVCTDEGSFAPQICGDEICWSVDRLTGERSFHSRLTEVNADYEIEGVEQMPIGRSGRKRRSLPNEFRNYMNKKSIQDTSTPASRMSYHSIVHQPKGVQSATGKLSAVNTRSVHTG